MKESVVLVHGLWMTGHEMFFLRQRLQRCGFQVYTFHYSSVIRTPRENARRLVSFVNRIDSDIVHFVAHSLGGIIICHYFSEVSHPRPGRSIMLGTPLKGSITATYAFSHRPLRWVLGRSVINGLLGGAPGWPRGRELAMIAGQRHYLGIGTFIAAPLKGSHDGVVRVCETQVPAVTHHMIVDKGHFGLLLSGMVAHQVCCYLRSGEWCVGSGDLKNLTL